MGQVADMLDLTPRAISRLADGLENDGLIKRTAKPEDGRVFTIQLTQKGKVKFKEVESVLKPELASLFSCLSAQELRTFIKTIEKLTDHMKSQIDED